MAYLGAMDAYSPSTRIDNSDRIRGDKELFDRAVRLHAEPGGLKIGVCIDTRFNEKRLYAVQFKGTRLEARKIYRYGWSKTISRSAFAKIYKAIVAPAEYTPMLEEARIARCL